ncbi:hypothetical protein RAC89_12530 [Paenibacillus sp. GD4]|uniref:hypothetical protein n=1 Tax=Paenibacillus sp. GD4 TaxID=3068890 RepID=UPI0027964C6C|nr:hypothetical protein [Paenibacillus sp. GD4]MDQ1911272.1 hypothetical protein [Paenibacillus sp. GD4]
MAQVGFWSAGHTGVWFGGNVESVSQLRGSVPRGESLAGMSELLAFHTVDSRGTVWMLRPIRGLHGLQAAVGDLFYKESKCGAV